MLKRTVSTAAIWSIVFLALYFGRMWGGIALLAVVALAAQWEYYGLREATGAPVYKKIGLALGVLWLATVASLLIGKAAIESVLVLGFFLTFLTAFVLKPPGAEHLRAVVETAFGVLYVPVLLSFFIFGIKEFVGFGVVNAEVKGIWLAVAVIAIIKAGDVGGLLLGKAIGKHKIMPKISPAKSWEGLLGGVLLSIGIAAAFYWAGGRFDVLPSFSALMPLWAWAVFAVVMSVVGLLSDLSESAFKRAADKKDSGGFIPGIGGALDMCDSLLFTAPVATHFLWVSSMFFNS